MEQNWEAKYQEWLQQIEEACHKEETEKASLEAEIQILQEQNEKLNSQLEEIQKFYLRLQNFSQKPSKEELSMNQRENF